MYKLSEITDYNRNLYEQGVKESGNPCSSKPRSEHESHFRWNGSRTPC